MKAEKNAAQGTGINRAEEVLMSSEYESILREALSGLGSYSKLANGNFRLQAPSGQTCAVYFSGNAPGNAVEIGLSAKALAPIFGRTEAEIAEGVAAQAAQTGRERIVSGLRGKYPGLAVGSRRELQEFLLAWAEFARRPARGEVLETTRVEKAAHDAGFDLTPVHEGNGMTFRSSAFPQALAVVAQAGGTYGVGFSVAAWDRKVAYDCTSDAQFDTGPWPSGSLATRPCMPSSSAPGGSPVCFRARARGSLRARHNACRRRERMKAAWWANAVPVAQCLRCGMLCIMRADRKEPSC
ncbi:MAG: hypothetical protein ABTS16_01445 [Candidatus Accumulibacter phosphatis]|jgi:hypothetical protein|uniref:hypothetical protein n=1 Tax=Candidatus Accumulibacter contiguus TaxID=2954381 RepID=UPI002FC3032B